MAIVAYTFDVKRASAYLELCSELYRHDPNWIAPLRKRALAQFAPEFPFYRQAGNAHCHFLATAGGRPVGHASAMINARLKDEKGDSIGAVGFFECNENGAVAAELLGHACDWLRAQHRVRRIWVPMQFDVWHGYRAMTRGFESQTFFGEPYNKSYYPALFVRHGFSGCKRWYSVEVTGRESLQRLIDPWVNAHERALGDGYRFVPIDTRDLGFVRALQSAIEGSYRNFLGLTPLAPEEFREVFAGYAEALDPRMGIAGLDPNGRLCGFAIAYPDYGRALRYMRGRDSLVAKLGFYLRSRQLKRAVFFMIGVTPEESARRRGLGRALHYRCLSALLRAGFDSVVFALLAEDSPGWSLLGDRKSEAQKEYALYQAVFER